MLSECITDLCAKITMVSLWACFISVTLLHMVSSFALHSAHECPNHDLGIIGGHNVKIEDIPFIAALFVQEEGKYQAVCGGSIIHERFVLTAAHCLGFYPDMAKRVLIGSDRIDTGGVFIDVEAELCHPAFDMRDLKDDICLLKLKEPVTFGCKVSQVTLPHKEFTMAEGTMVNVTGWGDTGNFFTSFENELYQTEIPIVSHGSCSAIYWDIEGSQICAGAVDHDSCNGDSGGPLTYNNVQVGIVSYGEGCGTFPGVYTRVTSYLEWIDETVQDNL